MRGYWFWVGVAGLDQMGFNNLNNTGWITRATIFENPHFPELTVAIYNHSYCRFCEPFYKALHFHYGVVVMSTIETKTTNILMVF